MYCRSHHVKIDVNSVLNIERAKYMCLNIKKNYLMAPLDRFEYMKMSLAVPRMDQITI